MGTFTLDYVAETPLGAIFHNLAKGRRHLKAIGSRENGNPNAKEKPAHCFKLPAYSGRMRPNRDVSTTDSDFTTIYSDLVHTKMMFENRIRIDFYGRGMEIFKCKFQKFLNFN